MQQKKRFDRLARFQVRHAGWVVILALVLTVAGGELSRHLTIETDISQLLPESYQSVRTLDQIRDKIGSINTLQVLVEGHDFAVMKSYADTVAAAIAKSPYVSFVEYKRDVEFYEKNALLYASVEDLTSIKNRLQDRVQQAKLKASPLYTNLFGEEEEETPGLTFEDLEKKYKPTDQDRYFINPDSTVLVLNVYPKGWNTDIAFARELYADVRARVVPTDPGALNLTVEYGGNFKNKIDEYDVIIHDVTGSAAIGISLVFLTIIIYFRRLLAVIVVGFPLVLALAVTFGLTYLVIGQLNTFTVFLFIILFGLGIDFGIHMLARYTEERRRTSAYPEALHETVRESGRAMFTAAATTSLAFYTLMFTHFRGFSEFGFIAGTGVLFSLVAMLLVLPSLLAFAEKLHLFKIKGITALTQGLREHRFPFPKTVLLVGIGFAIFSVYGLSRLRFEYDFTNLRANLPESVKVKEKLGEIFKESNSPAIVMASSPQEVDAIVAALHKEMATDKTPTIDKVRTIYSFLPDHQQEKMKIIGQIRKLVSDPAIKLLSDEEQKKVQQLRDLTDVHPLTIKELPYDIRRRFIGKNGQILDFALIYPSISLRYANKAIEFADDVRNIRTASGQVFHASSPSIVSTDMLLTMLHEGRVAVFTVLGAVFLVVLIDMRSPLRAVIAMSPLIVGLLWTFGIMFLAGWKLNIFNMVVIPSLLGMGVDSGVYIYHRYRNEGPGSVVKVLRYTGGAVAMASITTMVGFSGLLTAHHPGLRAIGSLAVVGLSCTLVSAVTILPAILQAAEDHKRKKSAKSEETPAVVSREGETSGVGR